MQGPCNTLLTHHVTLVTLLTFAFPLPTPQLFRGMYARYLEVWLRYFPRSSFLILQSEECFKDWRGCVKQVCVSRVGMVQGGQGGALYCIQGVGAVGRCEECTKDWRGCMKQVCGYGCCVLGEGDGDGGSGHCH